MASPLTAVADPIAHEQRFVLRNADWSTYVGMLSALGERPVRLTYDRGRLELMTLSLGHERISHLLAKFVDVLADEMDLPLLGAGSTTFKREDLDRGLVPDQCIYLENEQRVREKDEIDLLVDPPPDLAIEVDVTRGSVNRLGIYAAFGVPEVWRFDGKQLIVYRLKETTYETQDASSQFPNIPLAELTRFLERRTEMDETRLIRAFRQWVRERLAA